MNEGRTTPSNSREAQRCLASSLCPNQQKTEHIDSRQLTAVLRPIRSAATGQTPAPEVEARYGREPGLQTQPGGTLSPHHLEAWRAPQGMQSAAQHHLELRGSAA